MIVKAQDPPPDEFVLCHAHIGSCAGSSVAATFSDCCNHSVDPVGFAYTNWRMLKDASHVLSVSVNTLIKQ